MMTHLRSGKVFIGVIVFLTIIIAVFSSPPIAKSAPMNVILIDDPVFGVDTVIRDVPNQRDYLRLDFTTPYNYNEIITKFGPGEEFEDWRVASQAELELLGVSAGIVHDSDDPAIVAKAEQLRDWFCVACVNISESHISARGLVSDEIFGPIPEVQEWVQLAFAIGTRINVDPHTADFRISGWGRRIWSNEEIFLVRNVPLPASICFFASGLAALISFRKKVTN